VHTLDYTLDATDGLARAGTLTTRRGSFPTPMFMPVGTQGTVKTLSQQDLRDAGAQIILGNTYHLLVRSDPERIRRFGGIHGFISWDRSVLTDSGGFQVFSLGALNKITEDGVTFQSHHDGTDYFLSPESSIEVQHNLGADIIMAFDQCPPYPCSVSDLTEASERSVRWAARSLLAHERLITERPDILPPALFGILQGGTSAWLRREQATVFSEMEFPGYAIGGLSVGEPKELMWEMLDEAVPLLPQAKPHYLMGVGYPDDLVEGVSRGIDLFDCVIPTRNGRRGQVFTRTGALKLTGARFAEDAEPIERDCSCEACREHSRAYIHHLMRTGEILGMRLCTLHNITYYMRLVDEMRKAIEAKCFQQWRNDFKRDYGCEN
jgi:queuine tRNA-ribosyltransferase